MTFQDVWTLIRSDGHKVGILFLILKEVKAVTHSINFFKLLWSLHTADGRANFWTNLKAALKAAFIPEK